MPRLPIQPKKQGNKKSSGLDVEEGVWQNLKKRWVDNINGGVSMRGGERVWNSQPTKPLKVFIFYKSFAQTQMHCRVNTVICLFHDFTEQQKKQHFEFSSEILSVYIPTIKLRPGLHLI